MQLWIVILFFDVNLLIYFEYNMIVDQLNLDEFDDDDGTNANENEANVAQASNLFDEERGPEFDTTLTPWA